MFLSDRSQYMFKFAEMKANLNLYLNNKRFSVHKKMRLFLIM